MMARETPAQARTPTFRPADLRRFAAASWGAARINTSSTMALVLTI